MMSPVRATVGPHSPGTDLAHPESQRSVRYVTHHSLIRHGLSKAPSLIYTPPRQTCNHTPPNPSSSSTPGNPTPTLWRLAKPSENPSGPPGKPTFYPTSRTKARAGLYWLANNYCANFSDTGLAGLMGRSKGDMENEVGSVEQFDVRGRFDVLADPGSRGYGHVLHRVSGCPLSLLRLALWDRSEHASRSCSHLTMLQVPQQGRLRAPRDPLCPAIRTLDLLATLQRDRQHLCPILREPMCPSLRDR